MVLIKAFDFYCCTNTVTYFTTLCFVNTMLLSIHSIYYNMLVDQYSRLLPKVTEVTKKQSQNSLIYQKLLR